MKTHKTKDSKIIDLVNLETSHLVGSSFSAVAQKDTPRQKEIICELIDLCDGDTIYLDWDGKDVPKDEEKAYVMDYDKND